MGNKFVVLEGLSGSGKTTIGKALAKRMGAFFYLTPPPPFDVVRDQIDRSADISARFLFYLAGVVQASVEIADLLKKQSVVCDRYLLTTVCYHRVVGAKIDIPDFVFASILQPDHTFLIICDDAKRKQRMKIRGLSYNDEKEGYFQIATKFLAEYRRYSLIEIDNSDNDPQIAVEKIVDFLKG